MKKTIYQLFALSVALLPALSCEKEKDGDGLQEEGIRLTLSCDDIATRTDEPGVGSENLIKTVDYFVFRSDPNGNPTGGYTLRGIHEPKVESSCTFYIQAAVVDNGDYFIYSIVNYPSERDRGTDFGPVQGDQTKTLQELQEILVSERPLDEVEGEIAANTFTAVSGSSVNPAPESSRTFIMTGLSGKFTVSAGAEGNIKGDAEIDLKRLAAKVDMEFHVCNSVTIEKDNGKTIEVWTPMIDGGKISLALNNAVENAYIGGGDIGGDVSYFSYSPNYDNAVGEVIPRNGESYTTMNSAPFYTYPKSWSIGDDGEPFLKLVIPWKLTRTRHAGELNERTTTSQKELYYKIVLPKEMSGNGFESNKWYRLELFITQLGSESDVPEFDLPCGYKVINWKGDPNFVIAKIVQGLYLDVSNGKVKDGRTHYTMYSAPLEIPYIAANGGVTVNVKTMTFTKYGTEPAEEWQLSSAGWKWREVGSDTWLTPTGGKTSGRTETAADLDRIIVLDEFNQIVTIKHDLDANYDGNSYDVSPFTIEFTLHLNKDTGTTYDKPITVTQYPPLYIEMNPRGAESDGYVWVSETSTNHTRPSTQATFQEVYVGAHTYDNFLGSVIDYNAVYGQTGANTNPNLYKVSASILDLKMTVDGVSMDMVLGDSREENSSYADDQLKGHDDDNNGVDDVIPGVLSDLDGYRKTDENKKNFVSPSFLIASSYGRTLNVTYEGAVKRCAAYQEDGYPGGRWRLPTMAEIEYVIKLSDTDKIPKLFSVGINTTNWNTKYYSGTSGYWAAGKELYTVTQRNNITEVARGFVNLSGVPAGNNTVQTGTTSTSNARSYKPSGSNDVYLGYVRCVYDTWYWGDKPDTGYNNTSHNRVLDENDHYKTTR